MPDPSETAKTEAAPPATPPPIISTMRPRLSETAMGAGPSSGTDSILSGEFCNKGQQPKIADEELPHIRKIHLK